MARIVVTGPIPDEAAEALRAPGHEVVVGTGAAPAVLGTARTPAGRRVPLMLALAALAGLFAFGYWRVPAAPSPVVAGVKLRLMQPNLPQDAKFNCRNGEAILNNYLALSDRATSPTGPAV